MKSLRSECLAVRPITVGTLAGDLSAIFLNCLNSDRFPIVIPLDCLRSAAQRPKTPPVRLRCDEHETDLWARHLPFVHLNWILPDGATCDGPAFGPTPTASALPLVRVAILFRVCSGPWNVEGTVMTFQPEREPGSVARPGVLAKSESHNAVKDGAPMNAWTTCRIVGPRRRAVVTPFLAVIILVLLMFSSFAIDIGHICTTRSELQRTCDNSALAEVL